MRQILSPVAAALYYAHARGVVHRDVKPANILLTRDEIPVLADFGLSIMMGSLPRLTRTGKLTGNTGTNMPLSGRGAWILAATHPNVQRLEIQGRAPTGRLRGGCVRFARAGCELAHRKFSNWAR